MYMPIKKSENVHANKDVRKMYMPIKKSGTCTCQLRSPENVHANKEVI